MAFDSTQPTNTTKIRNLGNVIRPNWTAILTADATFKPYAINFDNRTPLVVPNDPAAIANVYGVYAKQDGSGNLQLYAINPASKITKLTSNIVPVAATNGYTYLPGDLLLQWGKATANGGANTDVFFPVVFSGAPYSVTLTLYRSSGSAGQNIYIITDIPPDTTHFVVYTSGGARDFFWKAIGPKS